MILFIGAGLVLALGAWAYWKPPNEWGPEPGTGHGDSHTRY